MQITCQKRSSNSCNDKMFFTTAVINTVLTISYESADVASAAAADDFSNDQDSVEVYYYKTNKNERFSVQDPIKDLIMVTIPKIL